MPAPPPRLERLARHGHVVEGLLAAVLELLPLLVALAGYHHHVARPGALHGACDRAACPARARPRPGARHDLVDDRLGPLRARVVGGHDHRSASSGRRRPMSARLPRSRSPPAPNTTCRRRAGELRAPRARSRASRACGRSPRARRSPGPRPRARSARAHARSRERDLAHPEQCTAATAPSVAHVEEARQRRLDLYLPIRRIDGGTKRAPVKS